MVQIADGELGEESLWKKEASSETSGDKTEEYL